VLRHRIAIATGQSTESVRATMSAEEIDDWRVYFTHYDIEEFRHASLLSNLLNALLKMTGHNAFKPRDFYPTCEL
jgi:hypothetical protein